jgi:hypothetical protein
MASCIENWAAPAFPVDTGNFFDEAALDLFFNKSIHSLKLSHH